MFKRRKGSISTREYHMPTSTITSWESLKLEYTIGTYKWVCVDTATRKDCEMADEENTKRYMERERSYRCLKETDPNIAAIKTIPKPTNSERFSHFEHWKTEKSAYDISMASALLALEYGMIPCVHYDPVVAVEEYQRRERDKSTISAPPIPALPPATPPIPIPHAPGLYPALHYVGSPGSAQGKSSM